MFVLEELLILLLQFVFELLFDILAWFPWDIFLGWREDKRPPGLRASDKWLIPLGGVVLGGIRRSLARRPANHGPASRGSQVVEPRCDTVALRRTGASAF